LFLPSGTFPDGVVNCFCNPFFQGEIAMRWQMVLSAIVTSMSLFAGTAGATILTNGSFESSSLTITNGFGAQFGTSTTALPGWNAVSNGIFWYFQTAQFGTAEDGSKFVEYDETGSLSQSFAVTAGTHYNVSFWAGLRSDAEGSPSITASIGLGSGTAAGTLSEAATGLTRVGTGSTPSGWQEFSFNFTPDTSTTATLTLASGTWACVDNVSVTSSVPEPSTVSLVVVGMISLLAYAWQKRR
jgi:hypothetical protein